MDPCKYASHPQTPPARVEEDWPTTIDFGAQTFVFSGVFEALDRGKEEARVKRLGGKVGSGVTGKTTILVVGGHIEDFGGNPKPLEEGGKYKKALEFQEAFDRKETTKAGKLKIPTRVAILKESEYFALFTRESEAKSRESMAEAHAKIEPILPAHPPVQEDAPTSENSGRPPVSSSGTPRRESLWVDLFAPINSGQLIGNPGCRTKLKEFLQDWHSVNILGNKKKVPFVIGSGSLNSRACLISGPPGVGKSTSAKLLAQECGYHVEELNASDKRSKKLMEEQTGALSSNTSITGFCQKSPQNRQKTCIIMDEVDGMSGGDRGGGLALIQIIKKTQCPIICICNDRMSPKVRSLANHCLDLKFIRPQTPQIMARLLGICKGQEAEIPENQLEEIIESVGHDVRQSINQLQLMITGAQDGKVAPYVPGTFESKDSLLMLNPFDASKRLLNSRERGSHDVPGLLDAFFTDYDLVPPLVQENYLDALGKASDLDTLKKMEKSAHVFANSDLLNNIMRGANDWSALQYIGLHTVVASGYCQGFLGKPKFPQFLGRYSTRTRNTRVLNEMKAGTWPMTGGCSASLRMRMTDFLGCHISQLLHDSQTEEAIHLLDTYQLSREALAENLDFIKVNPSIPAGAKEKFSIPSKFGSINYASLAKNVKASFTREYKKRSRYFQQHGPPEKKAKVAGDPAGEDQEEDGDSAGEDILVET